MKTFRLTILGTNSANPGFGRITSAQILDYNHQLILIDCGEASQIRLTEYKIKRSKIDLICISHLHGDHIYGLPGLLSSLSNSGRTAKLKICGPPNISKYINHTTELTGGRINYPIEFIELTHQTGIQEVALFNKDLRVSAFPMKHRIQTYGYRFDELTGDYKVRKEMIPKYGLEIEEIKSLKRGENVKRQNGDVLDFKSFTHPQKEPRSYAYCSDTIYDEELIPYVEKVNALYHETTYLHELKHLAVERMHSTTIDAANIAKKAEIGKLITGHYSSRYRSVDELIEEAKTVFPAVVKGYDGVILDI